MPMPVNTTEVYTDHEARICALEAQIRELLEKPEKPKKDK